MLVSTLVLFAAPALAAGPIHIPLTRHVKRAPYQQSIGGVNTADAVGLSFPIQLGTPPQDLSVLLGMGSGVGLTMFGCNNCTGPPFYKPKLSSTWNKTTSAGGPFSVAYDTASVLGQTVPKAPCAYGNSTDAPKQFSPATGQGGQFSLGLGLKANDAIGAVVPALSAGWDEPLFGVHIAQGSGGGQLTFGGLDNTLYSGNVNYVPTLNNRTWNFAADGLKVDNSKLDLDAYLASQAAAMAQAQAAQAQAGGGDAGANGPRRLVIRPEIGSDVLQVTPGIAQQIFNPITGSARTEGLPDSQNDDLIRASTGMPTSSGYSYTVPCSTNATLSFTVNGTDYHIPAGKWVISDTSGGANCKTRVSVSNQESFGDELYDMLVGTVFLDTVYSAYRYDAVQPQIGFAQLSEKANQPTTSSGATPKPTGSGTATSGAGRNAAGLGVAVLALAVAVVA